MASKINKGEILAKFFDDGEYTALFADGAVSAACGYAAGQQAYAVYQNGEAVTVKDVEKNIKVLEMAAQTGCPVVTFYNSVGAKLAEGLDVLTASAKLNAQIAKVSGVIPQVAVVLGVCGGTSALSAANADVCIMAEGAELFFTAPFTSAAKGDKVADAGTAAAAAKAGVAAIVAPTAEEAAEKAAHIVGLLPANNLTGPAIFEFEQPTAALAAGAEPAKAAAAVVDKDSAVELYAGFGKSVYTAFATVGGNAVGVVATGKTLCHNCVAKASRFVRLCDAFSVPVITIVDTEGFVPSATDDIAGGIREARPSGCYLCRRYHRKGGCAGWQGRRPCLHRSGCCRSAHCRGWLHRQRTGTQRSGQRPVQGRDRCFRQHHCSHQRKGCCLHRRGVQRSKCSCLRRC